MEMVKVTRKGHIMVGALDKWSRMVGVEATIEASVSDKSAPFGEGKEESPL